MGTRKVKEPKKETVRITLPPRPAASSPASNGGERDTVRINLPTRAPATSPAPRVPDDLPKPPPPPRPISRPSMLPGLGQPPKGSPLAEILPDEPGTFIEEVSSLSEPAAPTFRPPPPTVLKREEELPEAHPSAPSPGPKKETARIEEMPQRASTAPTVKMTKTQPLIAAPAASAESAPVFVAPGEPDTPLDSIPMSLCWGLLAISALLFIIQLWIYFS